MRWALVWLQLATVPEVDAGAVPIGRHVRRVGEVEHVSVMATGRAECVDARKWHPWMFVRFSIADGQRTAGLDAAIRTLAHLRLAGPTVPRT